MISTKTFGILNSWAYFSKNLRVVFPELSSKRNIFERQNKARIKYPNCLLSCSIEDRNGVSSSEKSFAL